MKDVFPLPDIPGYISIKQAAKLLGLSERRVYHYVELGRLPAVKASRDIMLLLEDVQQFKRNLPGRPRKGSPSWRKLQVGRPLLTTLIEVQVREGQEGVLEERLREIEEGERHIFPGTVARYVIRQDTVPITVSILLVWKKSEFPDETV